MPPLPADFIHARACKLKCEKILTRPEIEATSSDAAAKIDALATALTNLKTAAKGGAGLTTVSKQMQALANAAKLINSSSINTVKLKEMTSALNG